MTETVTRRSGEETPEKIKVTKMHLCFDGKRVCGDEDYPEYWNEEWKLSPEGYHEVHERRC
jgi:hypothetical protein